MARKSRREIVKEVQTEKVWKVAIYVRLSCEDERKIESESVENQLNFLREYVSGDPCMEVVDEYLDRGVSGTKFDRPEFERMMGDMRSERIDCIVVKDLSRLGRNFLETGDYIEKIFPFFGVRFIAVNDGYDSQHVRQEDGLIVPMKNLINEMYAKDISRKISSARAKMREEGVMVIAFAPYGYQKDPKDKYMIVVDEEVRGVVIRIFDEFLGGKGVCAIARGLNGDGIPSPGVHLKNKGLRKDEISSFWRGDQVHQILENEMYIGDAVLGKTMRGLYKGNKKRTKNDDAVYVRDHHEAIIDRETFNRVKDIFDKQKADYKEMRKRIEGARNQKEDLLRGVLYCGHCGNRMSIYRRTKKHKTMVSTFSNYFCKRSSSYGDLDPAKNIRVHKLEGVIYELIKAHIAIYYEERDKIRAMNRMPAASEQRKKIQKGIERMRKRAVKLDGIIRGLYEDFADGVLKEQEYLDMKQKYLQEKAGLEKEISDAERQMVDLSEDYSGGEEAKEAFGRFAEVEGLSRELVETFIQKISYYGKGKLEVEYRFGDELERMRGMGGSNGAT